jgi:toxin FitB
VIILDTNVVSETMQPRPSSRVMIWLERCPTEDAFLTSVTEAEILAGIAMMPDGRRQTLIRIAWEKLVEVYLDRILPFDRIAAQHYAKIVAARRRLGRPISQSDAQIAAITRSSGATLATRNLRDFEHCGVELVNPFA